ncbi:hypothetical protein [Pseudomonas sp. NPDC089569]|uniref:hypothetical protein n=1 Tax=Pseudomonas sp. NPDC089569 TaxID=3390722 RepID=UPI003D063E2D
MPKPSGLIVFESADDIQIKIVNSSPMLSAPGFLCSLPVYTLCLTSGVEDEVRPGFDAPLAYLKSGGVETGSKQVWFKSRDAANHLILRIEEAFNQQKIEHQLDLRTPYQESFKTKIQTWIGTCATAIFVCFLGAGSANLGWKTFDPIVSSLTDVHHSSDQLQEKLAQEVYQLNNARSSQAAIREWMDSRALQEQRFANFKTSLNLAEEKIKAAANRQNAAWNAQQASDQAGEKAGKIMQAFQLLPEQEPQDQ